MAQTTYQVILSTDGKHTVIATTDDPSVAQQAAAWAKATYDEIVNRYGLKNGQHKVEASGEDSGKAEEAPICAIHQVPMSLVQGRKGPFWSCHERNADGSWCNYRPKDR